MQILDQDWSALISLKYCQLHETDWMPKVAGAFRVSLSLLAFIISALIFLVAALMKFGHFFTAISRVGTAGYTPALLQSRSDVPDSTR